MTYLHFHALFLLPPLALLSALVARRASTLPARSRWALPAVLGIALAYTTPWDNYLVRRGVWSYGAERVVGTIGWVPVEEYLFFVLQPLAVGMLLLLQLGRTVPGRGTIDGATHARSVVSVKASGAVLYGVAALSGAAALLAGGRFTYAGLILAWACPVLAAQWWFAAPAALRYRRAAAHAVLWPTLYLWAADRVAIGAGIWSIAPEMSTGAALLGLPIEEALFFLVTNLLVVQGLLWFVAPGGRVALGDARVRSALPASA